MNQRAMTATVLALLFCVGCRGTLHYGSTSFLSKFSLEDLVKRNSSPSGMLCAKGGLGGGGGSVFGTGAHGSSSSKSSSFSCQVNAADAFDEAAFITSLKADVESEIKTAGAEIVGRGVPTADEFYFDYRHGDIAGRVTISEKKYGNLYSLTGSLDEKSVN